MQIYDNGEWGTKPSKLDDAKNSSELIAIMNSIGFRSLTEMDCRTGTGQLSMRERRTEKGVDTIYPYCFLLPVSGFFQAIIFKDTKSLARFFRACFGMRCGNSAWPKEQDWRSFFLCKTIECLACNEQIYTLL